MRVTVADCLELDAFKGAEVIAGKLNLSNDVKTISVLDACNTEDLELDGTEKTEILLTGFLGIRDDVKKQCELIHDIAARGCAALAVYHVGKVVKKLDEKVVDTADREMLPLILMPEGTGYMRAITAVSYTHLDFDRELQIFRIFRIDS